MVSSSASFSMEFADAMGERSGATAHGLIPDWLKAQLGIGGGAGTVTGGRAEITGHNPKAANGRPCSWWPAAGGGQIDVNFRNTPRAARSVRRGQSPQVPLS